MHTQGPWRWTLDRSAIEAGAPASRELVLWPRNVGAPADNWVHALGACGKETEDPETARDNALLIAAAPALFNVLDPDLLIEVAKVLKALGSPYAEALNDLAIKQTLAIGIAQGRISP